MADLMDHSISVPNLRDRSIEPRPSSSSQAPISPAKGRRRAPPSVDALELEDSTASAGLPSCHSSPKRRSLRLLDEEEELLPPPISRSRPRVLTLSPSTLHCDRAEHLDHWPMGSLDLDRPESPAPNREDFRASIPCGVAVIFFDFDGTLTATPGDRASRRTKQVELQARAPMLGPRLKALRQSGASLGIISKSTESTIRSALEACQLHKLFDAPLVAKAVGFEGKVGFIEDLAVRGCLPRLGSTRGHQVAFHRILLVDDDLLELDRARQRGLQTYAAPEDGGLQEEDFEVIAESLRLPRPSSHPLPSHARIPNSFTSRCRSAAAPSRPVRLPSIDARSRWKTRILFSGDCLGDF